MADLYHFNNRPEFQQPHQYQPTARNAEKKSTDWGDCRARAEVNLGYILAFCNLLRVDELLKIQTHDIVMKKDPKTGITTLTLTLPFGKTSQFGGQHSFVHYFVLILMSLTDIKPFVLYEMPPQLAHLCAVRAYAKWVHFSNVTAGYVFRKIRANDRIAEDNEPMVSVYPMLYSFYLISQDLDVRTISRNVSQQLD